MPNIEAFTKIKTLIEAHERFVLLSHVNTDGDALGSLIGLHLYLHSISKKSSIFVPGNIPKKYAFLDTDKLINQGDPESQEKCITEAEVIFILDISNLTRLDAYYATVKKSAAQKILIDHHPAKQEWTQIALIDSERIATAELIYELLKYLNAQIAPAIAKALYTAILSDSGSFRFFKTGSATFRMAADLVEKGAEPSEMFSRIFETARAGQLRAWGSLLTTLQRTDSCSWIEISKDFMQTHRLELHEVDGLMDIMRIDNGATAFAVFIEKERNEILVGLRSKEKVDVGRIARHFGGGGHFHASGYTSTMSLTETVTLTLKALQESVAKDKDDSISYSR